MTINPLIPLGTNPEHELVRRFGQYDPKRLVSLGDVAMVSDAEEALFCAHALDWSDIALRRAVIGGVILPAIKRATDRFKSRRLRKAVSALSRWVDGDDRVDLRMWASRASDASLEAVKISERATAGAVASAMRAAEWPAPIAGSMAMWAADEVALAAGTESDAERELQRADIIAAFPPVALDKELQ